MYIDFINIYILCILKWNI